MGKSTVPTAASIGQRLRAARETAGKTQAEIASSLSVAVARISEYENGKREPGAAILWKLARAVGVSTDDLLR